MLIDTDWDGPSRQAAESFINAMDSRISFQGMTKDCNSPGLLGKAPTRLSLSYNHTCRSLPNALRTPTTARFDSRSIICPLTSQPLLSGNHCRLCSQNAIEGSINGSSNSSFPLMSQTIRRGSGCVETAAISVPSGENFRACIQA